MIHIKVPVRRQDGDNRTRIRAQHKLRGPSQLGILFIADRRVGILEGLLISFQGSVRCVPTASPWRSSNALTQAVEVRS